MRHRLCCPENAQCGNRTTGTAGLGAELRELDSPQGQAWSSALRALRHVNEQISDAAVAELRADIAANGLLAPITLYEDKVLDGWHRYNACGATGTEPRFRVFEGDEEAARQFVVTNAETIAAVESGKVSVSRAAKQVRASTPRAAPTTKAQPDNVTTLPVNTGSVTLEQWAARAPDMRTALLRRRNSKATLNRQNERQDPPDAHCRQRVTVPGLPPGWREQLSLSVPAA